MRHRLRAWLHLVWEASRHSVQVAFVTIVVSGYARLLGATITYDATHRIFIAADLTRGFARGGTTVGAVFLTRICPADPVLRHEAVHIEQWRRYGLTFPVRYFAEEWRHRGAANKFEIEAGLTDGGYRT